MESLHYETPAARGAAPPAALAKMLATASPPQPAAASAAAAPAAASAPAGAAAAAVPAASAPAAVETAAAAQAIASAGLGSAAGEVQQTTVAPLFECPYVFYKSLHERYLLHTDDDPYSLECFFGQHIRMGGAYWVFSSLWLLGSSEAPLALSTSSSSTFPAASPSSDSLAASPAAAPPSAAATTAALTFPLFPSTISPTTRSSQSAALSQPSATAVAASLLGEKQAAGIPFSSSAAAAAAAPSQALDIATAGAGNEDLRTGTATAFLAFSAAAAATDSAVSSVSSVSSAAGTAASCLSSLSFSSVAASYANVVSVAPPTLCELITVPSPSTAAILPSATQQPAAVSLFDKATASPAASSPLKPPLAVCSPPPFAAADGRRTPSSHFADFDSSSPATPLHTHPCFSPEQEKFSALLHTHPSFSQEKRLPTPLYTHPCSSREDKLTAWIFSCQHSSGGFGQGPHQDPHITSTHYAVLLMLCMNRLQLLDLEKIASWVRQLRMPGGGFKGDRWGECDTRFAYCGAACLTLIGHFDRDTALQTVFYVQKCKNIDGGYAWVPGGESHAASAFCCIATLALCEGLATVEREKLATWLLERQLQTGGFNGRPEKAPDVCYSFWILAALAIIGYMHWVDTEALTRFVLEAQDELRGGIADRPGDMPDVFHTYFGIAALSLMQTIPGIKKVHPVFSIPCEVAHREKLGCCVLWG